jgi:LacI family transcriptional regulator
LSRHELIGIFIDPMHGYRDAVLDGIGRYLRGHARRWRPVVVDRETDEMAQVLRKWEGDGIIYSAPFPRMTEAVARRRKRIPAVNVSGPGDVESYSVIGDHHAVGAAAAEHLLEHALPRYAFVGWDSPFAVERREGYVQRLRQGGATCTIFDSVRAAVTGVRRLLDDARPIGLFACSDTLAMGAVQQLAEAGVVVPRDVAVVGAGNWRAICELSHPPLSSVDVDYPRRGYLAAAMLDALMSGKAVTGPVLVPPRECVARESTAVYGHNDPAVRKAVAFIAEHGNETIGVDDVARASGVSRRKLEQAFATALGRTIHDQIWHQHVACARRLLIDSGLSMHAVAKRCGFSSASSFSTTFQRHTGQTPRDYRLNAGANGLG